MEIKKFEFDNPAIICKNRIKYNICGEPIFFIELDHIKIKREYCDNEINDALIEEYEWVTNREVSYNQIISGWPFPFHLLHVNSEGNRKKAITWTFSMSNELKKAIVECKCHGIRNYLINLYNEYLDLARTVNMIWMDSPYDNYINSGFPIGNCFFPLKEIDNSTIDQFISRAIGR